jgi:adenosine kinase
MDFPDKFKNHILPGSIHILNVCFSVDKMEKSKGGTAGNIAYTMNLLGAKPILISAVGRDGDEYIRYLKEQGIEIKYISVDTKKFTASCYITTDLDDNQITAFYNGALGKALEAKLPHGSLASKVRLAIIAPTQKGVMIKHINECYRKGIRVMFDIGQQITAFNNIELKNAVEKAYFLIGNDYEVKVMQNRLGWDTKEIFKRVKILITTLGAKGSIIQTVAGETIKIKACPPKKVIDPTGAGDAWRAGFLAGYEKGFDSKTCGQMGSVAASFGIEKYGTQEHKFRLGEFIKRYKNTYTQKLVF